MNGPKRVLLVEDDPKDVELIWETLAENNLAKVMIIVNDGAEALDFLYFRGRFARREPVYPVAVILDLHLPKLNGLEVLRQMKNDAQLKRLPVIMLSSSREAADVAECYRRGVNAYVVKPAAAADFADVVKRIGAFFSLVNEPPPCGRSRKDE